MRKISFGMIAKGMKAAMKKHSPEILTGIGITGMITAAVLAVKATPKALILIEDSKNNSKSDVKENKETFEEKKTKKSKLLKYNRFADIISLDTVKLCWKCYTPAVLTGILSIACLIGANSAHVRHKAALMAAYSLSESTLKEYQDKVVETIGERKEKIVRDAIAKDKIERDPVTSHEVIITDIGNTLCYDVISGRYFKSDIDKIKRAENQLNRLMRDDMYISLNDFYYEIGLSSIKLGDDLGWNIQDGYIDLNFSSQLANDDTPCLVIDYHYGPKYDYRQLL